MIILLLLLILLFLSIYNKQWKTAFIIYLIPAMLIGLFTAAFAHDSGPLGTTDEIKLIAMIIGFALCWPALIIYMYLT